MNNQIKHTPGPWSVDRLGRKFVIREGVYGYHGSTIATISSYRPMDVREASAA